MKIGAETKYNIGQTVYYVLPSRVTNEDYDAFIYELEILEIHIIDCNDNYVYRTDPIYCKTSLLEIMYENELFEKLKYAQDYAEKQGYKKVKVLC